jgi:aspartyl-tRNA(Asn)/glutamyl-tRNA(Gln) amidotransferase subunit C
MEFSPEIIKKVASLAKIKLSDNEITLFNQQFSDICKVILQLQEVDTSNVKPITNPSQATILFREDKISDGGYVDDIMANAPKSSFNCFAVPKVLE